MFCSGYDQDWSFLPKDFNFHIYKQISKKNHKCSKALLCSKKLIKKFGDYIYSGYENDKIGLFRKYEKYKNL